MDTDLIFLWIIVPSLVTIGALLFAFWIWMLIDCVMTIPPDDKNKIIWVLILLFAHLIGAILYYFFGRPHHRRAMRPSLHFDQ